MNKIYTGTMWTALALSVNALSYAASTPEATLKEFLTAMQKRDRKVLRESIDWNAMGKTLGLAKESSERRPALLKQYQVVYVESFALGKMADNFKVGKVTTKGNVAQGGFLQQDKTTKKWNPATQFKLAKKGKNWLITGIAGPAATRTSQR